MDDPGQRLENLERESTCLDFRQIHLMGMWGLDWRQEGELGNLYSHPKEKRDGSGNEEENIVRANKEVESAEIQGI